MGTEPSFSLKQAATARVGLVRISENYSLLAANLKKWLQLFATGARDGGGGGGKAINVAQQS